MPSDDVRINSSEPGLLLGWGLLAIVVFPQVAWFIRGYDSVHDLELAGWGFFMSGLMWASYSFRSKSFLFRGILSVFKYWHIPRGSGWALAYSVCFALIGIWYVLLFVQSGI